MSGPPAAYTAVAYSFTTIFGTVLNGSEITWYNDPTKDDTNDHRTKLRFYWVQNLFSSLYTFYDGNLAAATDDDPKYYIGKINYRDINDGTAPTADETSGTPQTNYYTGSTLFHMQIANPVSSSTPSYDGFWTLV